MLWTLAWTAEQGSRTLVHATIAGKDSHGVMLDRYKISNKILAPWIQSREGEKVQEKVWVQLSRKLEGIVPGIMKNV